MRLLFDEHYSPKIAAVLRERGYDAFSFEEAGLERGLPDDALLAAAADQGRALLTNNARDFVPLARQWAAEGRTHAGIVLTADTSLPRSTAGIGDFVEALAALFDAHPDDTALTETTRWLEPSS